MNDIRIEIPDHLKSYLEVENCDDFNIARYHLTPAIKELYNKIINNYELAPEYHALGFNYINTCLLYGLPGTGKAQPLYSQVMTPEGFKDLGQLQVGDKVISYSSRVATIQGIYPQGRKSVYEIILEDGSKYRCSDEHLCHIRNRQERGGENIELKELLKRDFHKYGMINSFLELKQIDEIKYVGEDVCQCIYIDDPSHLYITDDNIYTHNTYFCKYLAATQHLDLAYINFAKMLGGLGDANRIISDIFRFMADTKCVFMMDEIDCIARKRSKEGTDIAITLSSNTITVMQELDYYRSHNVNSIIMAATNREDTLDEALLSRFAIKHHMEPLTNMDKEKYLINCLKDAGLPFREEDIQHYCARNSRLEQRNMELDMIQGIGVWIRGGKKGNVQIEHIR